MNKQDIGPIAAVFATVKFLGKWILSQFEIYS